ncbi:MAG: RsmE family RNA methyltransferase [Pelagibacteraceae bacterium]|jgi:16S rRNA (uracil1498-N3)-methyltransferase|nr:RsmE family RNA methyltransferase [Pelagibacteraceae bacterium]|tara:strand:- start:305 stop:1027 length:723 start_codon:yes stop_codon:yes gene_type:complete
MSSKTRLYFPNKIQSNLISHLTKDQSHYTKDVMRLKIGDSLSIFNSQGEWNAIIESYEKEGTRIKILKKARDKDNEKNIWLAFSLIKQNPLNFLIQKGTELGVQKFVPILSERTIVKKINIERIKKIIVESSEQSNRISVPEIKNLEPLKKFLSQFPKNGYLIFCDINCNKNNLKNILSKKIEGPICVLIGPEGDFSETERQSIIELNQAHSLSLANNILRAETAAVTAVSIINYYLNFA